VAAEAGALGRLLHSAKVVGKTRAQLAAPNLPSKYLR
jgi:hypothetical protein